MTAQEREYFKLAITLFCRFAHVSWNISMLRLEVLPFNKESGYFLTREGMQKYSKEEVVQTMFQYWSYLENKRVAEHIVNQEAPLLVDPQEGVCQK